jgi:hypothetical protein
MADLPVSRLSRRHFLTAMGATGVAVALGACGGGDDTDAGGPDPTAGTDGTLQLAQYFGGPLFAAGAPLRAPFGLADSEGLLPVEETPEELEVDVLTPDGEQVAGPVAVRRHAEGLERAYFPLELTLEEPGSYLVRAQLAEAGTEMALEVSDPSSLTVIRPGMPLPALETPTLEDPRGVTPICTREPLCELHDVTAAQALGEARPLALLVATPAFCQVTICGPVLDILLDVLPDHPEVRALHAEVYTNPAVSLTEFAPTVRALGLHLEPCLVLVGSDGTVVERFDAIYDRVELDQALARLT